MENVSDYTLSIKSGLYAGVTRDLVAGYYVLGASSEADIVLMEDGITDKNAALSFAKNKMQIEALTIKVSVNGRDLPKGEKIIVNLPVSFMVGGVQLACALSAKKIGDAQNMLNLSSISVNAKQRNWLGVGILGLGCLLFIASPILKGLGVGGSGNILKSSLIPVKPSIIAQTRGPVTPQEVKDAADKLRREAARFLSMRVTSEQGTVVVSGTVSPNDLDQWNKIAEKFDIEHSGRIELISQLTTRNTKDRDLPKIEAYWAGANPYVIVDGRRFFVGSKIEPGWIFDGIEDNLVQMERDGRKVSIQQNQ